MNVGRVAGKVAIVTGAASGLGAATASMLAREGATVIVADINKTNGARVAARIVEAGHRAEFVEHDAGDEVSWQKLIQHVEKKYLHLDILVNNAGIMVAKSLADTSLEDFRRVSRVNVDGVFLGTKYAVDLMVRTAVPGTAPRGSIVNMSSFLGSYTMPNTTAYCASKGAVRILSKSVAVECGAKRYQIRVNSVHPGITRTEGAEALMPEESWQPGSSLMPSFPLRDYGRPDDVANAVLYLASDEARLVTGTELFVDGGWSMI
jgi:3(or 17)beta-hydroxysteroid dehydrogenase